MHSNAVSKACLVSDEFVDQPALLSALLYSCVQAPPGTHKEKGSDATSPNLEVGHETSVTVNVKWCGVAMVGMSETTPLLEKGRISNLIE